MVAKLYVEVLKWASSFLEEKGYEPYLAEYLLQERQGWSKTDLISRLRQPVEAEVLEQLQQDLAAVVKGLPAQYVIGSCEFYGYRFKVTPDTLIPRPETEELVQRCLQNNDKNRRLKVLDIGTGTGAIAISLKKEAPNWEVTAVDISSAALAVAQENSQQLATKIHFVESDLTHEVQNETFDIIISNPPYIAATEWDVMDESVREHEPKLALFAENNGLAIYQRLANEVLTISDADVKIYLEIGYQQGAAVQGVFAKTLPQKTISVQKDLFGQDRMVIIE